jgi:hypothetical protein
MHGGGVDMPFTRLVDGESDMSAINVNELQEAVEDLQSDKADLAGPTFTGTVILDDAQATGDVELDGALNHDGTTVGFYGTTPIVKQTGVAVSTAAIHAALVNLGLIGA